MKLIITQKQSRRLIKETLGVPKSIEFWVDTFSEVINDGLMMLLSSDDREVFFTGDDIQEKALHLYVIVLPVIVNMVSSHQS